MEVYKNNSIGKSIQNKRSNKEISGEMTKIFIGIKSKQREIYEETGEPDRLMLLIICDVIFQEIKTVNKTRIINYFKENLIRRIRIMPVTSNRINRIKKKILFLYYIKDCMWLTLSYYIACIFKLVITFTSSTLCIIFVIYLTKVRK